MRYREFGRTGLKVSAVGFGCIKFREVPEEEVTRAVRRAVELGVNYFDTANSYHDSEEKLGKAIEGIRDRVIISSKTYAREAQGAWEHIELSRERMGVDYIDIYMLHSVSDGETYRKVTSPGGALEALEEAKVKGVIGHIGASIHRDLRTMEEAILSGKFEMVMLAYSPLDQEGVAPRILPMAKEQGVGVAIMKPLSGGQLSSPPGCLPEAEPDPIVRGSLRFVLSNPAVSTVIPGMTCVREVEENVPVADMPPLSEEEKDELIRRIGSLGKEFRYGQRCLRCWYCQPCPQGVVIPEVFRAWDMYRDYPDDLKYLGLELYRSLEVKPDGCVECRECTEKCPAGLDIPNLLKEAMEALEGAM